MNAYMNIQVRVLGAAAQAQIKALRAEVARLNGQIAAGGAAANGPAAIGSARSRQSLQKWGNQLQWTGRQLQHNWTIPLAIAGGAAVKFALDNEKAFTHVKKVYGDTADAADFFQKKNRNLSREMAESKANKVFAEELDALGDAFKAVSSHYGVAQKGVMEVAGAWAAAGASGVDLAKSVDLTMKAMILGDMDAAKATQALIAIQAQYSLSTEQLGLTLAELNAIENQTGISMQGLIEGFARAAGVAREAGVDVRHLGAMLAALVPSTGTAAQAGNALKTIFSRLMSPTKEAAQVMHEMGLNITAMDWQGATAVERLQMMSKEFNKLSDSQKQVASSVIASRWQINKFNVLMRELGPEVSYYEKALDATASKTKVFAQMHKELNAVLSSNPKRLEQIWYTLQNAMADIIVPLLPYLLYLANTVKNLVDSFSNLDPTLQKFILLGGLMLMILPLAIRYFGSLMTLIWALALPLRLMHKNFNLFGHSLIDVDGQVHRVRRGILATIASFVAWPFKMILSGMGAMVSGLVTLWRMVGIGPAVAAAWGAAWSAIVTVFRGVVLGPLLVVATNAMYAVESAMLRGGFRSATAFGAGLVRVLGTISLVFGAAGAALKAHLAAMAWAVIQFGGRTVGITSGFHATMLAIWTAFNSRLIGLQALLSNGLSTIWAVTCIKLANISAIASAKISTIHAAFSARLLTITQAIGARWLATWTAIHSGMLAISRGFWTKIVQVWVASMLFLRRLPLLLIAGFKNAPKAIWAALRQIGPLLLRAFPITALVATIIGVLYTFRSQIARIWHNIVAYFSDSSNAMTRAVLSAWYALPQGVANALTAVARIVRDAALAIYSWFSYINPFARHSPSLVENVTNGMARIKNEFAGLRDIQGHIKTAYNAIKAFGRATASLKAGADTFRQAEDLKKIQKFAPGAAGAYMRLVVVLRALNADLAKMEVQVKKQEAVVERWKSRLDAANDALDKQRAKLEKLQDKASAWQDKLDAASNALQTYASTPIIGMRKMEDAIFANEMAQKRLRLEMLKMEEQSGVSLDNLRNKLAMLQGEQEKLLGEREDLRAAGAGSEITKVYDQQLAAMQAQAKAVQDQAKPLQDLNDQLEKLQRQAEIMDLEKSLKFDPLTRAIEQAANVMEEMPFDKIMAGIQKSQAEIAKYSEKVKEANDAVAQQQKVVDEATAARDKIAERLDREQNKLDRLNEAYQNLSSAIRDVERAMSDVVSAADAMQSKLDKAKGKKGKKEYVSPGLQNFRDAAGGDFANVGGAGLPIRQDWESQAADIKKFTDELSRETASMFGNLNPFSGIKKKWGEFKGWMSARWADFKKGFADMFSKIGEGVNFGGLKQGWSNVTGWLGRTWDKVWGGIKNVAKLFLPDIKRIWAAISDAGKKIWKDIGPELSKFGDLLGPLGDMFKNLWTVIKPVAAIIGGALLLAIKLIVSIISTTLGPVLSTIIDVVENVIQALRGVIEFVVGVFTLDWKLAWQGILDILGGTFGTIGQLLAGLGKILLGIVSGIVTGIVEFFTWLWDVLVGHSIIPDTVNAIVAWFQWMLTPLKVVWDAIGKAWDTIKELWNTAWDAIKGFFSTWWGNLKTSMTAAWDWVTNTAGSIWNKVTELWKTGWEAVKNFFVTRWENLKTNMSTAWDWIKNTAGAVWNKVKELWTTGWEAVKNFFITRWENLKTNMTAAWDWIKNTAGAVWGKVKELWVTGWEGVKNFFTTRWENLKGNMSGAWNWIKNVGGGVWDAVKNKWSGMLEKIKGIVGGAIDWIQNKINGITGAIDGAISKVGKLNPFSGFDFNFSFAKGGVIPYAQGGEVGLMSKNSGPFMTSSPIALVGEGNPQFPEFVIPTDPLYRRRAQSLWLAAGRKLGLSGARMRAFAAGGTTTGNYGSGSGAGGLGGDTMIWNDNRSTTVNIYGNLEFPNIRHDSDAEEFINNLDSLVG